jgi:hypothetical protein
MKKWTWILLALSVGIILFVWSIRENFQDTATLKGPPYGDSDYPIIVNLMSTALVTKLQDKYSAENSGEGKPSKSTLEGQRKIVDGTISSLMGDFHTTVYQPASLSLTEANVDTFLESKATSGFLLENKAEIKKLLVAYFVNQTAGAQNANLTEAQIRSNARASNSGYASMLADLGQTSSSVAGDPSQPICPSGTTLINGWCGKPDVDATIVCSQNSTYTPPFGCAASNQISHSEKIALGFQHNIDENKYFKMPTITCPTGYTYNQHTEKTCEDRQKQRPTCSTGYTYNTLTRKCDKGAGAQSGAQSQMTANNNPNVAGISNNLRKGNIWGPAWTGLGDNSGSGLGDGDRIYPILLGPKPSLSKMVEGGGIAPVSQAQSLVSSGVLPDPTSTGSDPSSQFFGTARSPAKDGGPGGAGGAGGASRVPGDQDLFPNPYVEFTPSSGSSKTEPVPYLADFSAFLN